MGIPCEGDFRKPWPNPPAGCSTSICALISSNVGCVAGVSDAQCAACPGSLAAGGFAATTVAAIRAMKDFSVSAPGLICAVATGAITQAQAEALATAAGISLD